MANELNREQKTAVKYITEWYNRPLPFLLFGPPGTGKTRVLVASTAVIVRTTKKNVLICAPSNAACDEITERLLKVLQPGEVFRLYAKTHDANSVSRSKRPVCNLQNGEFKFPCLKFLYQYRVLVCTLSTAGCLVRAREVDPDFSSSHFGFTLIDEAAFTHESNTLIPIAGK